MNSHRFSSNPAFHTSVELLERLHVLMRDDKDDEEGDRLREQMESPWFAMDDSEQDLVRAMSADLKTLEPDSPIKHANRDRFISDDLSAKMAPLILNRQWDQVLDLLRETPAEISLDLAAQYRAEAYAKLGEESIAERFLAEAWRLNPKLPDLQFVDAGIRGIFPEATTVPSVIPQSTH